MQEKKLRNPDFYQVLGVDKDATSDQIKAAYVRLILENHPDKNLGDVAKAEFTKQVNQAYEILRDSGKRNAYDIELEAARSSKKPRHSSNESSTASIPPLFLAAMNGDFNGVELELKRCSIYNFVYQRTEMVYENRRMHLCALDIAIIKGYLPIVELILKLNFDISYEVIESCTLVMGGEDYVSKSCNIFVIAAKYYKKEIFDSLIKKLSEQNIHGAIDPPKQKLIKGADVKRGQLFYLKMALRSIIGELEAVSFEIVDKLLAEGIAPFEECLLDGLSFKPSSSLLTSAYVRRYGPGRCITACIRHGKSEYLSKLASMGFPVPIADESGYTVYKALTDAPLPGIGDLTKTREIFKKILHAQILPSYSDFLNAAKRNSCALYILLEWELKAVNPLLEEKQYIDLFITMLRRLPFTGKEVRNIFFLLDNKYENFCKKVDKDGNNFLHIIATVEGRLMPICFLNFFEKELQKKYPDQVNNILAALVSAQNKKKKTPCELGFKSEAVKTKFQAWQAYSSRPKSTFQTQSRSTSSQPTFFTPANGFFTFLEQPVFPVSNSERRKKNDEPQAGPSQ